MCWYKTCLPNSMKNLSMIIFFTLFISCGKDGSLIPQREETIYKVEPAETEDYTYEFAKRKCTTGKHSFDTFVKACEGLKDTAKNNDCAEEEREELFQTANCPGTFS